MPLSSGLSHVALSVPAGTLTDDYRARLLDFYGRRLGWREMEALRRPDRRRDRFLHQHPGTA
jgi:hypothetical protein